VVILDNLATHKIRGVREALEAARARLLYLPPYSPDFNPIEPIWKCFRRTGRSPGQVAISRRPRTSPAGASITHLRKFGIFLAAQFLASL
jgi:hypothetical protein